jgi:hypothetical protein
VICCVNPFRGKSNFILHLVLPEIGRCALDVIALIGSIDIAPVRLIGGIWKRHSSFSLNDSWLPVQVLASPAHAAGERVLSGAHSGLPARVQLGSERRHDMQDRPADAGEDGTMGQSLADGVKMLLKEDIIPGEVAFLKTLLPFGGALPLMSSLAGFYRPTQWGTCMRFHFLECVGIIMAGWASNNKYALLVGYMQSKLSARNPRDVAFDRHLGARACSRLCTPGKAGLSGWGIGSRSDPSFCLSFTFSPAEESNSLTSRSGMGASGRLARVQWDALLFHDLEGAMFLVSGLRQLFQGMERSFVSGMVAMIKRCFVLVRPLAAGSPGLTADVYPWKSFSHPFLQHAQGALAVLW